MYKKLKLLLICIVQYFKYKLLYRSRIEMKIINSLKGKFSIELMCGSKCHIGSFIMTAGPFYLKCTENANISIGDKCYFNHNCSITCAEKIEIGDNCIFANNLVIVDHDHNLSGKGVDQGLNKSPVKIGKNVWCGANVTILKGVKIGDGAVIAAGAVVNKDVPAYELWGGVPARSIKSFTDENI